MVSRPTNLNLPRCPEHPGSRVRAEGTQGKATRVRLRCFYTDTDGTPRKHGFTPQEQAPDPSAVLYGGRYTAADVADALVDVARGSSYTDAARRVTAVRAELGGPMAEDAGPTSGRLVAAWVDRFAQGVADALAEQSWPQTVVADSTEFSWTNPRTGERIQLFTVLAVWGYPAGATRGRLWALRAYPRDDADTWSDLLSSLPGTPDLVIYDSDKGIAAAVPRVWPDATLYLCEHHLYLNAVKRLRDDDQHGWGNTYRTLLARAAQSYTGWSVFRNAVLADPGLPETRAWVTYWDAQLTAQTARRPHLPAHRSTGALDPHLAKVRQVLGPRSWTYRNLQRMNSLLGLVRLSINLRDRTTEWAGIVAAQGTSTLGRTLDEPLTVRKDGARVYSLRTHPVPPRE